MSAADTEPKTRSVDETYYSHWADIAARRTVAANPESKKQVCAAGITPSGVVHIGNFREVMTVELVARALRDQGHEARFIYSWDDFDVFRKVPAGMPQPEMLERHLRQSIAVSAAEQKLDRAEERAQAMARALTRVPVAERQAQPVEWGFSPILPFATPASSFWPPGSS